MYLFSQQKGGLEITNQWWGCFYTPFGERCDERWGNGSPSRTGLSMESVPWHEDVRDFAQQLSQSLPGYEIACEHEHSCSVLLAHRDRFFTPFGHWSLAWTDSSAFVLASKGNCSSNYFQEVPSVFGLSSCPNMLFDSFFLILFLLNLGWVVAHTVTGGLCVLAHFCVLYIYIYGVGWGVVGY